MGNTERAPHYDVLIVGGGHGGAQAAISLRQGGVAGSIAIITEEACLPYERPPLSKDFLAGDVPFEKILLRKQDFWSAKDIELLLNQRVVAVDVEHRSVRTRGGSEFEYGKMIWAAGGRARRLSCEGGNLAGVHSIRNRQDVEALKGELPSSSTICIVGGGYIGLEAAAVLVKLGKRVVLLEAMDRILARVAGEGLSAFYQAEHRSQGVEIMLGATVGAIEGEGGRVRGVRLGTGEVIGADAVIVGIGIEPEVEPLLSVGAEGGNGVKVDANCSTSLPNIFAIGDCALHRNGFADCAWIRLESVQNASDMAQAVAATILGSPTPYSAVPWFWSNQYDLKLQTVGLSIGHDRAVLRGNPEMRSFSVIYLRNGRVIAIDCVNAVRDYVQGRALVAAGTTIAPDLLGDSSIPLKEMQASE